MLLSLTGSLLMFYLLFCIARMNFAGPFDLGIYGAVNNWFVARRALATSIATLAQMAGLVALPLIAQAAIAARRLARRLGRRRHRRAGDRLRPELAADGAPAGGRRICA